MPGQRYTGRHLRVGGPLVARCKRSGQPGSSCPVVSPASPGNRLWRQRAPAVCRGRRERLRREICTRWAVAALAPLSSGQCCVDNHTCRVKITLTQHVQALVHRCRPDSSQHIAWVAYYATPGAPLWMRSGLQGCTSAAHVVSVISPGQYGLSTQHWPLRQWGKSSDSQRVQYSRAGAPGDLCTTAGRRLAP